MKPHCLKPELHETNFSREANFSPANSKFNFHWHNFFCEFAANNAKQHGICSKIVVIEYSEQKAKKGVLGSKNLFRTSAEGGVSSFGRGLTLT